MFNNSTLFITFISTEDIRIEVKPVFIDPAKANSLKYITSKNLNRFDSSATGIDEPKVPPQKNMIADFKNNKQNYNDLRTMIEESRKRDNESFGMEIVKAALEIKEKKEMNKSKKNFIAEHSQNVKHWQDVT